MSFFYNEYGDNMKLYLDVIFLLNFGFDFILLLSVSLLLRRNVSYKKIILGALIGGLSIFVLFMKISSFTLFILKIIISIIMCITAFSYKNIRYTLKNIIYLYSSSMVLGGFLYFLNVQFSYKQEGLVFYHNGLSVNFIFLIVTSPIIIYLYVKQGLQLKNTYSNHYKVNITYKNKIYNINGFLDTGNKLVDPYFKKPVIILNQDIINFKNDEYILVPMHTICEDRLLKCFKVDEFEVVGLGSKKVWVGVSQQKIKMEGIDCILHSKIMEE